MKSHWRVIKNYLLTTKSLLGCPRTFKVRDWSRELVNQRCIKRSSLPAARIRIFLQWMVGVWLCSSAMVSFGQKAERPTYPFNWEWLVEHARALSNKPFDSHTLTDDSPLSKLSYDQYRAIRFDKAAAIWANEGRNFTVDLFHPGFIFRTPVAINLVTADISRRVLYTSQVFDYGLDTKLAKQEIAPGYSGFRIRTPIRDEKTFDEFLVFQGASYFRAIGKAQQYGLSARGLAINTARPEGEEFPAFTQFWIERPTHNADKIRLFALLESESLTGAYTFTATPGDFTTVDVNAVLFARKKVTAYGVAPLTSMFLFDGTNRKRFDDFRPAVHDSDGLQITLGNGENIWRALANPVDLQVSVFSTSGVKGFGLMQRRRDFREFQDDEARYELRPSAWVEPLSDWGAGHVELIEIPTNREIHDNVVAFWQPQKPLKKGQQQTFSYRLHWGRDAPMADYPARVAATRAGQALDDDVRLFVIDFEADSIPKNLVIEATTSAGKIVDVRGHIVKPTGRYRVNLRFDPQGKNIAEFRLVVASGGQPWSETWLYRWTK